jgi:hypothetical protein
VAVAIGMDQRGIMAGKSTEILAWYFHIIDITY